MTEEWTEQELIEEAEDKEWRDLEKRGVVDYTGLLNELGIERSQGWTPADWFWPERQYELLEAYTDEDDGYAHVFYVIVDRVNHEVVTTFEFGPHEMDLACDIVNRLNEIYNPALKEEEE